MFVAVTFGAIVTVVLITLIGYLVFHELQEQNAEIHAQNEHLQRIALAADAEAEARADQTRRVLRKFNLGQDREDRRNQQLMRRLTRAVQNNVDRIDDLIRAILRTSPEGREILRDLRQVDGGRDSPRS
jgi:flagellar biosynthesis/type III secretory pathway M-ring protein FliF/YscJ